MQRLEPGFPFQWDLHLFRYGYSPYRSLPTKSSYLHKEIHLDPRYIAYLVLCRTTDNLHHASRNGHRR